MTSDRSMTAAEASHIRHEVCIANDAAKALQTLIARSEISPDARSLIQRATEKLDEIIDFIDGRSTPKKPETPVTSLVTVGPCDAVLVDDDPLIQGSWKLRARLAGKRLLIFSSAEDLVAKIDAIDLQVPVYIDLRLGSAQMQGVALAEELHRRGFRELYLSTGLSKDECPALAIIKGVRGKSPPWAA